MLAPFLLGACAAATRPTAGDACAVGDAAADAAVLGGTCHTLDPGPQVPFMHPTAPAPTFRGGVVADGTYRLRAVRHYSDSALCSGAYAFTQARGVWYNAYQWPGFPSERFSMTVEFRDTHVIGSVFCPAERGVSAEYTATGTGVVLGLGDGDLFEFERE